MDFMKVFDQTVREIKREVNLKVLKVPEIEQKVLDATNDEAWGPHGTALSEIAQATKKFTECQMIMNVLWNRLTDTGPNWRHVYKALTVIEYLLANGSERAVDDILEHISQISSISGFEYVEPNGKDDGVNVRKKVETILSLVSDREKIQAARDKAAANRDKYIGLSSTGMSYKPSSASYGSDSYYSSYRSSKEGESFKDSYKEGDQDGEDAASYRSKGGQSKSRETSNNISEGIKVKKGIGNRTRNQDSLPSSKLKTLNKPSPPHKSSSTQASSDDNDLDDFDPRGLSASRSAGANSNHVDLFGQSLVGDLLDASTSIPTPTTAFHDAATTEVDLFADATFVSAPPQFEAASASHSQGNVDLFANQSVFNNAVAPNIDIFAAPVSGLPTAKESSQFKQTNTHAVDPFAAVPLNTFAESDSELFGAFTSHSDPVTTDPSQKPSATNLNSLDQATSTISKPAPKKDTFQVKSGIWADSLSRGLIDLNITAPKKVSLADIGIVGGLGDAFDEKEKGPPTSAYMGRAMGTGPGLGWSGVNYSASTAGGTGSTSNFGQQHQFGSFKS